MQCVMGIGLSDFKISQARSAIDGVNNKMRETKVLMSMVEIG